MGLKKGGNQTSFQKGKSGNPNGRPKAKYTWAILLEQALAEQHADKVTGETKTLKEWITRIAIKEASKGNMVAIKMIWDRMDGLPKQSTEISGHEGQPIEIKFVYDKDWQDRAEDNLFLPPSRAVSSPNGNPKLPS